MTRLITATTLIALIGLTSGSAYSDGMKKDGDMSMMGDKSMAMEKKDMGMDKEMSGNMDKGMDNKMAGEMHGDMKKPMEMPMK